MINHSEFKLSLATILPSERVLSTHSFLVRFASFEASCMTWKSPLQAAIRVLYSPTGITVPVTVHGSDKAVASVARSQKREKSQKYLKSLTYLWTYSMRSFLSS